MKFQKYILIIFFEIAFKSLAYHCLYYMESAAITPYFLKNTSSSWFDKGKGSIQFIDILHYH